MSSSCSRWVSKERRRSRPQETYRYERFKEKEGGSPTRARRIRVITYPDRGMVASEGKEIQPGNEQPGVHRCPGPPPCTLCSIKNPSGDTEQYRTPHKVSATNSVPLMVSYIVQCLHNEFLKPTSCKAGVPATCVGNDNQDTTTTVVSHYHGVGVVEWYVWYGTIPRLGNPRRL